MVAAIYARKSTDQNVADEEKSVTRQIDRATAYAQAKGWTVAAGHVYADDGISGAEFIERPGYLALMNALRPRPPFQALIVMEQSRLGRSLDEVPYALKRITDAGVRVYCYLTDSEVKRESAADKFMIHAIAFVDDMAREQSRERTRDALRRKVERGHVAGGMVYGYRNVRGLLTSPARSSPRRPRCSGGSRGPGRQAHGAGAHHRGGPPGGGTPDSKARQRPRPPEPTQARAVRARLGARALRGGDRHGWAPALASGGPPEPGAPAGGPR